MVSQGKPNTRESVTLVVRDEPGREHEAPFHIRLRAAMKRLLRSYGVRIIQLQEPPPTSNEATT